MVSIYIKMKCLEILNLLTEKHEGHCHTILVQQVIRFSSVIFLQGMASPVMKGMLKQSKTSGRKLSISIHGVPPDAVKVFVRYLYSCR